MEERGCKEYRIKTVSRRKRSYKKNAKRMDRRLYDAIEACLEALRADPLLGKKLTGQLAGMHSIRVNDFAYRIVYAIDNTDCSVLVHAILHRSEVYIDLARRT